MNMQVRWRKAAQSGADSNCVEASNFLDAVRDSKNPSVTLRSDVRRLLAAVKADSLTR